jgi:exosome complex RNA-binding protein Rrp4
MVAENFQRFGSRLIAGINGKVHFAATSDSQEVVLLVVITMTDADSVSELTAGDRL